MKYYKANISTPYGLFNIVVETNSADDAKQYILDSIYSEFNAPYQVKIVGGISKTNKSILKNFDRSKKADWSYFRKAKCAK